MKLTNIELQKIISFLKEKMSLRLLILFGSFATGHATSKSDIDLAFMSDEAFDSYTLWWDISQKLANEIGRNIDLIDMKKANDVFRFEIVSGGHIIFQDGNFDAYLDQVYTMYLQLNDDRKEILECYGR